MQIGLRSAIPKIIVFLLSVLLLVVILGTIMYIIEGIGGDNPGFQDIPNSIYWSIVTLTTVGYGTVVPVTIVGKIISAVIMLLGYGIIAVPTGIVTAGIIKNKTKISTQACINCSKEGHENDAEFCKYCGSKIHN
jgi:voltage-gated potassium channel